MNSKARIDPNTQKPAASRLMYGVAGLNVIELAGD